MSTPIFIYGAGGLGREILSFMDQLEQWSPAGFIDDSVSPGTIIKGLKVLGGPAALPVHAEGVNVVIAVGDPVVKKKMYDTLMLNSHIRFPALVHPDAILQDRSSIRIGDGAIITAGCILTTDVHIGNHVLINLRCTVGHDTIVGDFSSVMPGVNLAGQVQIGKGVLIGCGANVINRVQIGDSSRVGAGAVIIRNVPAGTRVVGVPGKIK